MLHHQHIVICASGPQNDAWSWVLAQLLHTRGDCRAGGLPAAPVRITAAGRSQHVSLRPLTLSRGLPLCSQPWCCSGDRVKTVATTPGRGQSREMVQVPAGACESSLAAFTFPPKVTGLPASLFQPHMLQAVLPILPVITGTTGKLTERMEPSLPFLLAVFISLS